MLNGWLGNLTSKRTKAVSESIVLCCCALRTAGAPRAIKTHYGRYKIHTSVPLVFLASPVS